MKEPDLNFKYAELRDEDIASIKSLEKRLGDICLIAVERGDALYAVEAKIAPNVWEPVDQVYPEIENLKSYYRDEETARLSKGALKSFLVSSRQHKGMKKPIRIRKIKFSDNKISTAAFQVEDRTDDSHR